MNVGGAGLRCLRFQAEKVQGLRDVDGIQGPKGIGLNGKKGLGV